MIMILYSSMWILSQPTNRTVIGCRYLYVRRHRRQTWFGVHRFWPKFVPRCNLSVSVAWKNLHL